MGGLLMWILIISLFKTLPHCPGRGAPGCSRVNRGELGCIGVHPREVFGKWGNPNAIDSKPQWNKSDLCPSRWNFGKSLPPLFMLLECTLVRFQCWDFHPKQIFHFWLAGVYPDRFHGQFSAPQSPVLYPSATPVHPGGTLNPAWGSEERCYLECVQIWTHLCKGKHLLQYLNNSSHTTYSNDKWHNLDLHHHNYPVEHKIRFASQCMLYYFHHSSANLVRLLLHLCIQSTQNFRYYSY